MSQSARILLDDQVANSVRVYDRPKDVVTAWRREDLPAAFARLEALSAAGYYLAGYAAYETGHSFEARLADFIPENPDIPLLRFGVYKSYHTVSDNLFNPCIAPPELSLRPAWTRDEYLARFEKVLAYIQAGDVYQINLTFPLTGQYDGTGIDLYTCLRERQPGQFGGVLAFDDFEIVSLSPELFYQTDAERISMRPMKGTAKRLPDPQADQAVRDAMRADIKSQAENLMIVDLLRNDLSRIAQTASVKVPELFTLETYPTLHQMTSRVEARLRPDTGFHDLFKSLFPCGSVTGAPKIRAMEIIQELEQRPRGAYCGAIGFIDPNGDSCFNVAIRTFTLKNGTITYNVGSGVVLDSQGVDEYDECLLKAAVTQSQPPYLIETLKYEAGQGCVRQDRHLARLERSAAALGYACEPTDARALLDQISSVDDQRVRLTLSQNGDCQLTTEPLIETVEPVDIAISKNPLSPEVQETRYKISARDFYNQELSRVKELTDCFDVIFLNPRGEICEGSFTNIFVKKDGLLFTPDLACGLLPGILREELIETGQVREAVLTLENLIEADEIYIGNSLRGLLRTRLVSPDPQ